MVSSLRMIFFIEGRFIFVREMERVGGKMNKFRVGKREFFSFL